MKRRRVNGYTFKETFFIKLKYKTVKKKRYFYTMSEAQIQSKLVIWFWNEFEEFRGLLYHNFSNPRNAVNGAQLLALGLVKGNPDLTLAIPRGGFGALYIELKKPREKPRPDQVKQMERLRSAGNCVEWADNFEDAKSLILKYLTLV